MTIFSVPLINYWLGRLGYEKQYNVKENPFDHFMEGLSLPVKANLHERSDTEPRKTCVTPDPHIFPPMKIFDVLPRLVCYNVCDFYSPFLLCYHVLILSISL